MDNDARFWSFVGAPGCWEWQGTTSQGYGYFWQDGVNRRAHRVLWERLYGPIPEGMQVCHACDNRRCVRPDHLFLGTHAENMQDSVRKGRRWKGGRPIERHRGEWNPNAKLTWEQVAVIRARLADGERGAHLAREYGVAKTQISRIKNRKGWVHVSESIGVKGIEIEAESTG